MPIICLFGADGSGKTSIARALMKELKGKGFDVIISWIRGTHTLASLLARFLSRFSAFRGSDNPYYGITIPKDLKKLWQLIEFISMLPVLFAKFLLPSILGYTVIAERYLPDFVVWIASTTGDSRYVNSSSAKLLLNLSSKAKVRVYVTAELEELAKRRSDVSTDTLSKQLRLYDAIAKRLNAFRLDTTGKTVKESLEALFSSIELE